LRGRFREVESAETSLPGATPCAILVSCLGFRVNFHGNEASRETLPAGAQGPLRLFRSLPGEVERLCRNERQILLAPVLSVGNINLPIRSRQNCPYAAGCVSAVRTLEIEMCPIWLTRYVVLFSARNLKRILKY